MKNQHLSIQLHKKKKKEISVSFLQKEMAKILPLLEQFLSSSATTG